VGGEAFPDTPGGLNRYLHDLFGALAEHGEQPRQIVLGPAAAPAPGTTVVPPGALAGRLRRFRSEVRRQATDAGVVDAHFALYAAAPVLTGGLAGRDLVVHFHGPWAEESEAVGESSRAALFAKRAMERAVYRRARTVVTLSSAFRRVAVERYGVSPWNVRVVPPAVDLERFTPGDRATARASLELPEGAPLAVAVRRLVPRMGLDVAIEAWSGLPQGLLVIVGEGPDRPRLERLAADLGCAERVRFAGRISDEALPEHYRAADVSLLPSLSLEGFGLAALESLACGTPVIASDAGGLPEALAGLGHELVVPRGDAEALRRRLEGALGGEGGSGPSPLPAVSACRAHAERFSRSALASAHRDVYTAPLPRRRRVVYVDHTARLSGGEIALLRIIEALDDVDAHVILGEDGPLVARLHQAGISVEVLPLAEAARELRKGSVSARGLGLMAPLRTAGYVPRLARRLRALRPDWVHTNSLKSGIYGSMAARLAGVPVVWHLHDRISPDYLPAQAVRPMRRAIRTLPTKLVANSASSLETVGGAPRGGATVVPNPVSVPDAPREPADHVTRIGIVGRVTAWKGQDVFIEAFARAFPDGDVEAAIVGAPLFGAEEEAYEGSLRRRAADLGLGDRVDFRGFREDMGAELARLDVLVHASVTPEPFGQVIVEAMAAGVPVIAADAGGAAEIVTAGVDALVHRPGDVADLAAAMRQMAEDGALRRRLASEGRKRSQDFRAERVSEALSGVYGAGRSL
jgi:glycosyltransferase involved in cell wall biosynthesis